MSAPITSPFGHHTTALETVAGLDLSGRNAIVTGGASGIGVETVRALAVAGARVTIAARDVDKARVLAGEINGEIGAARVDAGALDLVDLASIAAFAAGWRGQGRPLHMLINNAGVMACPLTYTAAGFEMQIGANHLGHFQLTRALWPALAAAQGARVVSLSSIGHRRSPMRFDDPHFRNGGYDKWTAYGQSKTANALFAVALTREGAGDGIVSNAVMPGGIMTALQRHLPLEEQIAFGWIDEKGVPNPGMKTPAQGAATSVWAATAPALEGIGGLYLENCAQAAAWTQDLPWNGVFAYALDGDSAEWLWAWSLAELAPYA